MYSKQVMALFKAPRNMGVMLQPDAHAQFADGVHDNVIEVFLRIKGSCILDIRVRTFGCVGAIAASVMMSMMVKGKTMKAAGKISHADLTQALGGLPSGKEHCALLALQGLGAALKSYGKKG